MASGQRTILITGGTGYVGGQIVREALERGYHVRMTARSEASAQKALASFPEDHAAGRLSVAIVPDITKAESYREAFLLGGTTNAGGGGGGGGGGVVTGIIHSASPLVLAPEDHVRDLLEPAIRGSVAILEAARRWGAGSVARVVATSSFASIVDIGKGKRVGYTYDETDWNPVTYKEAADPAMDGVAAYCASKALAERAMWDWIAAHKSKNETDDDDDDDDDNDSDPPPPPPPPLSFDLVTICPPWVFGPYARAPPDTRRLSSSVSLLWDVVDSGRIPPFDFGGCADSRDVAAAHVLALGTPAAGGQRFLVGRPFRYQAAVDAARARFPALGLPAGEPGRDEPGYGVDGSKAERVLGLRYRSLEETVADMFAQLVGVRRREQVAEAEAEAQAQAQAQG